MACVVCAAAAAVYCDNDKALLCNACDVRVHTSNPVAARHTRHNLCEGRCGKACTLFCSCDNAHMCEACHSANPLAATHSVEPAMPLPAFELATAFPEAAPMPVPAESVAQSAASPADDWFMGGDVKPDMVSFAADAGLSPAGSEAVVPVMSAPVEEFQYTAPATFKDIKDKLEFEPFELENSWLEMGFDFSDILSDAPSDAGLVPTFNGAAAADMADPLADAAVPTFVEEMPSPEEPLPEVPVVPEPASRKRAPEPIEEEQFAKVPNMDQLAYQVPSASALFFPSQLLPAPAMPLPVAAPASAPAPAPAPRATAAYNAALANGANLTREQRVARYREKRKNRKFEKTIRYASRKAYAEIRPRIKGRFAKKEEIEAWKALHGGDDAVVPEVLDGDF
ncbi:hypothetical protein HYH03_001861 [Edaphochlamys debaryana]|uniref:Uncharacterized protein n=1 Tax=Edaphochlamys debaryana TaxID=47281 RepID=A0A835YCQ1_9CHLO|nr:hypothetical protein HYH03_001861 [Edaphochlamys debaryana]|eukprot:KAG2500283.1 hypothetical protein HYH03_001861 [Edaphochlamys debaryana]